MALITFSTRGVMASQLTHAVGDMFVVIEHLRPNLGANRSQSSLSPVEPLFSLQSVPLSLSTPSVGAAERVVATYHRLGTASADTALARERAGKIYPVGLRVTGIPDAA